MNTPQATTLITGASQGIGRALAIEFAQTGNNLFLISRDKSALDELCRKLSDQHGIIAHSLDIDLASKDGRRKIAPALNDANMFVENLVNNAGIGLCAPFAEQSQAELDHLINLNLSALTELSRAFLPQMLERNKGGILNIASLGGLLPGPYQAAYYASKAYVVSLTEALAQETASSSVRISVVIPGPVDTGFHRKMNAGNALYLRLFPVLSAERVARSAMRGYNWRRTVIAPGLFNTLSWLTLPLIPHWLSNPVMAWLLRPRAGRNTG